MSNQKATNYITNILAEEFGWCNRDSDGKIDTVDKEFKSGVCVRASFSSKDGTYLSAEILHDDDEAFYGDDLHELAEKLTSNLASLFERDQHTEYLIEDYKQSYKGLLTAFNVPVEYSEGGNVAFEIVNEESWHLTKIGRAVRTDLRMGYKDDILCQCGTNDRPLTYGTHLIWHHMNHVLIMAESQSGVPVFYLLDNSKKIETLPNTATGLIVYKDQPEDEIQVTFKLNLDVDEATDDSIFFYVNHCKELEDILKTNDFGCDDWKLLSYSLDDA